MVRLLLVAPTVDGSDVGEAWVAYQWATRLASSHDVTLLTYHKRGAPKASDQLRGLKVVEWPEPPLLGRQERLNSMLKPGYLAFFVRVRRWLRDARTAGMTFDLAHQPVPVAMRYPSPLAGSGIPYVLGPVGGSLPGPPGFMEDADAAPWYTRLRALDDWRLHHDPVLRRTYSEAACVLGVAPYVRQHLAAVPLRRFEVMSETALESLPDEVHRASHRSPVRLLFVGRLVRTKGARDVVRALSMLNDVDVALDIVGDGYDRSAIENAVREHSLGARVRLHGRLARSQVDVLYRAADVFVFPSYREAGGNVALEAMSFGLPLIVADVGGPASATDETCSLRVHPKDPLTYSADLAGAIRRLVLDRDLRVSMGQAARRRAETTALWANRVTAVNDLYEEICDAHT